MNGPVPLALSANGLSEVAVAGWALAAPFASAQVLEKMYQVSHSACRIGLGEARTKSTVWSSTFTDLHVGGRAGLDLRAVGCACGRAEKITSSAVKASPSWNLTSLRRWKRHLSRIDDLPALGEAGDDLQILVALGEAFHHVADARPA